MASLGNDLAQIRKKRNLSLDDIQQATKIPKRILRSIEDDSIFNDLEENSTYIRSYVRGYAKALSIGDKQIIHALDKREKNDYSGSLQKIAGIESTTPSESEDDEQPAKDESEEESSEQSDDTTHEDPAYQSEKEQQSTSDETTSQPATPTSSNRSEIRSIDWAEKGQQFQSLKKGRSKMGLVILVVILAVCGGLFFFYFSGDNGSSDNSENNTNQEAGTTLSTDTLELNISPSAENDTAAQELTAETDTTPTLQNESFEELPDTLEMIMYAAYGRMEPVRVYTDISDNINPYWIEEGEAMRFNFVNEIRIRGEYNNIVLIMNGHVVQNIREQFYNEDTRLVEINRNYFEGDPRWLQPAPDSLGIDVPPPSVINERPTFN